VARHMIGLLRCSGFGAAFAAPHKPVTADRRVSSLEEELRPRSPSDFSGCPHRSSDGPA
jgi:TPP-dependent indolepyruvate ferredoxin oxidoreductase alpha subunit